VDHHGGVSPRSIAGSATSTAYTGNIPARVLSPLNQKPLATIPGGSDVRVPVPLAHPHEASVQQWPGSSNHNSHHMAASQQYQQQQQLQLGNQAQTGRGSWDMASYLDNNATTAGGAPGAGSSMGYGSQNSNQNQSANVISNTRNVADNAVLGGEQHRNVRTPSLQSSHQIPRV